MTETTGNLMDDLQMDLSLEKEFVEDKWVHELRLKYEDGASHSVKMYSEFSYLSDTQLSNMLSELARRCR